MTRLQSSQLLRSADYQKMPWKNGLGITHQIAIDPLAQNFEALQFKWRLSSAPMQSDGQFSLFPGFMRLLAIIAGHSIKLTCHHLSHSLQPFQWHLFSGDVPVLAELSNGPIIDLNLIWRDEDYQVIADSMLIKANETTSWRAQGELSFLFLATGEIKTELGMMYPHDTYQFVGQNGSAIELQSSAAARALSISLVQRR